MKIFSDFEEFHGDRHVDDDGATVGELHIDECPITVIGQQKDGPPKINITRNFVSVLRKDIAKHCV